MNLAVKTDKSRYEKGSVRNAVSFALSSSASHAQQRFEHYSGICKKFEKKYKLASAKFVLQFDAGTLGDEQDYFDWYAATRGLSLWRERYFAAMQSAILAAPHVIQSDVTFDEISEDECYIRGVLTLAGGLELHIAEYVITEPNLKRLKYRFHLQSSTEKLVGRWDNAPHHPEVETHPDHFHISEKKVKQSPAMDIPQVLAAVLSFIE
jgi:hypothetical protein